jgi:iron complex outermembrane receptor protein
MSELIQKRDNRANIRRKLLTGASALVMTAYVTPSAHAEDSAQPQAWIELGGQLSRLDEGQEAFSPNFPNSPARPPIFSPSPKFERPSLYSIDELGGISFQSDGSDWVFSASVRYGRSGSDRHVHQQTYPKAEPWTISGVPVYFRSPVRPSGARYADTKARNSEQHVIVDFQAGKDFGLGLIGAGGSSVLNLGVRFAQFGTNFNIALKSDPDWHFSNKYVIGEYGAWFQPRHENAASLLAMRSFHGLGPLISWDASAPFAGNVKDGELTFDWTMNAALLFGRQKAKIHHQTTGRYQGKQHAPYPPPPITYQGPATPDTMRLHTVTVPDVGGSIGLSWRVEDFKISAGYRADFFFGAMDGGIDTRKSENVGFYGPFATISVGIGN